MNSLSTALIHYALICLNYIILFSVQDVSQRQGVKGSLFQFLKKGNVENVENYRGITLLSVVGKLFTSIIDNRLSEWAENYHVNIEAQAEFRNGMGTIANIFVLHGLISNWLNNCEKLFAAFVDFQNAFDYVVSDAALV